MDALELGIRDKSYVEVDGMLFNVTGYEHPSDAVYASLKYVDGQKWKAGYLAACEWLKSNHPEFIDEYIRIPLNRVTKVHDPGERWRDLRSQLTDSLSQLPQEAIRLGEELSAQLAIPISDFGITDSLLWGSGHAESDIDLVVYGAKYTNQILHRATELYSDDSDFQRPDPRIMTAPYSLEVRDWPSILARKLHMGSFRGRLFSLRVVLSETDLLQKPKSRFNAAPGSVADEIEFHIADVTESLCFPAIYRDDEGNELVDYSVVYEGVFRVGETVRARGTIEGTRRDTAGTITRFVIREAECV